MPIDSAQHVDEIFKSHSRRATGQFSKKIYPLTTF